MGRLTTRKQQYNNPRIPKHLVHLVQANIKPCRPHLLRRRLPLDINAKHVAQQRPRTMQRNATKEQDQERQPLDALQQRHPESLLLQPMPEHRERYRGYPVEYQQ